MAVIAAAIICQTDNCSRNKRRPANAAIGISETPTARTSPTGAMAKAVNHNPDAAAPKKPAGIEERQDVTAT